MNFNLSPLFTNNMILQRDAGIPIWGYVDSDIDINLSMNNQQIKATVEGNRWYGAFEVMEAGGPYELTITYDDKVISLHNILIGDVYLAGGQSNMQFLLSECSTAKDDIPLANYPNIRYFDVARIEDPSELAVTEQSPWRQCTKEIAGEFSAVAYHYAKNIHEKIDVPIGIINCNWGGTSASCWISQKDLESSDDLKFYLDEFKEKIEGITQETYLEEVEKYDVIVEEYISNTTKFKEQNPLATNGDSIDKFGDYPWPPPIGPTCFQRPSGLYETMLTRVIPYGIKGIIFYQGEGDAEHHRTYRSLLTTLINVWRREWHNSELPFLYVQIAYYDTHGDPEDTACLREAQLEVSKLVEHCYMTVTTDCSDKDDIHPSNKKTVGERLADLALSKIYDKEIEADCPIFDSYRINGNKIYISLTHCSEGLNYKGDSILGFEICGEDRNFLEATAIIIGKEICVYHEDIKTPTIVRYGWGNYVEVNLTNTSMLPVTPFRTSNY